MTSEAPVGLLPEAELRYRMVAHILNTRMVMPDAVAFCAEELIRYIKEGPKQPAALERYRSRAGVGTGVWTFGDPPAPQHGFPMAGPIGAQTQTIRQEDQ